MGRARAIAAAIGVPLREFRDDQGFSDMIEQEPTGYGHELLTEWAEWTRGGLGGGHHEWSVRERLDRERDTIPDRILEIDRLVAQFCREHPHYRKIVSSYYLDGRLTYWEIGGRWGYTPGFVRLCVQAACDWVDREFECLTSATP